MPLYEYECPGCGAKVEVLQKLGADGQALECRECAVAGLRKVISGGAVQTSGSHKFPSASGCGLAGSSGASGFT